MRALIAVFLCLILVSCAMGPVQVAKNEREAFKTTYDDPRLAKVYKVNEPVLRDIYQKYRLLGVDFYFEGLAVTGVKDDKGEVHPFVSIKIRPAALVFDREASEPDNWQERLARLVQKEFPTYIKYLRGNMKLEDVEGICFAIYWPIRDYTQCDKHGGSMEYAIVYSTKQDINDIIEGKRSFKDIAREREIIASFNLQPAKSMKITY